MNVVRVSLIGLKKFYDGSSTVSRMAIVLRKLKKSRSTKKIEKNVIPRNNCVVYVVVLIVPYER